MNNLGYCTAEVQPSENKMKVVLKSVSNPRLKNHKADCYCFKVLLIYWDGINRPPKPLQEETKWLPTGNKESVSEIIFKNIKGALHWVLFVRQWLGANEKWLDLNIADGMKVMEAGSCEL